MNDEVLDQLLEVVNHSSEPARIVIEPWADECTLKPRETCRIAYKTEPGHSMLELEYRKDGMAIHFPEGSLADFAD